MSTRVEVWDSIFRTPDTERGFDEDRPWLTNPRTQGGSADRAVQTMKFTSSLLLAATEVLGIASMRGWDLDDPADRERLWQHVREVDQLLAVLKVGLQEHENEQEDQ